MQAPFFLRGETKHNAMKKLHVYFVDFIFVLVFMMLIVSLVSCTSILHVNKDTAIYGENDLANKSSHQNLQSDKKIPKTEKTQTKVSLDRLNADLNKLETRMESQEDSIRKIENQINLLKKLNQRHPIKKKSSATILKSFGEHTPSLNGSSHTGKNFPVYTTPGKLYKRARSLLLEENFKQAAILFTRFIKKYPHNELSDNSFYWLGECHYSMGDYKGAVKIFKNLVKRYPRAGKVPDALLKTAYAYLALDDTDRANYYLKKVVTKYPFTDAGDKAALKLKAFQ